MPFKIILFENQLVIRNIKNKFGDTIKKYLHLQNIKLKKTFSETNYKYYYLAQCNYKRLCEYRCRNDGR